jgi:hypothetical protein
MEMSSDEARRRRWIEVETLSGSPKDEIFKLTDYFERVSGKDKDASE